jgi:hypothetical protein
VTNPTKTLVHVPHPIHSTALHLVLRAADGSEQVVTPGAVVAPGTVPQRVNPALPAGRSWDEEFDLADYLQLDRPGSYTLTLEYEWGDDGRWRSEPLPLTIAAPAGTATTVSPAEAGGAEIPRVLWVERDEQNRGRFLYWPGRASELRGARQVAEGAPDVAELALSITEPRKSWTENWAAWTQGGELHRAFFGEGLYPALPPQRVSLDALHVTRLVSPLLAEFSPNARPRCAVGVIDGQTLRLVELGADGTPARRGDVALGAAPEAAWATHHAKHGRMFVSTLQRGQSIAVAAVRAAYGSPPGALEQWLEAAGTFLAGDVRASADGSQTFVGVLAARQRAWARLTFRAPEPGKQAEPALASLELAPTAKLRRARLGPDGQMHLVIADGGALHYVPPGSATPTWSDERLGTHARFADLALPADGPPQLVVYDDERGPMLVPLR